ncbi:unnamed protein product [Caenorhabditis sp. 36 PRJEB53466]|nr:unnamed protein product [Caenorhabditis sp. 36 PRJEB53466]
MVTCYGQTSPPAGDLSADENGERDGQCGKVGGSLKFPVDNFNSVRISQRHYLNIIAGMVASFNETRCNEKNGNVTDQLKSPRPKATMIGSCGATWMGMVVVESASNQSNFACLPSSELKIDDNVTVVNSVKNEEKTGKVVECTKKYKHTFYRDIDDGGDDQ